MSIINCIEMCKDKERKSKMIIMLMQLNSYDDIVLLLYQSIKYLSRKLYNEPQSGDDKTIYVG